MSSGSKHVLYPAGVSSHLYRDEMIYPICEVRGQVGWFLVSWVISFSRQGSVCLSQKALIRDSKEFGLCYIERRTQPDRGFVLKRYLENLEDVLGHYS